MQIARSLPSGGGGPTPVFGLRFLALLCCALAAACGPSAPAPAPVATADPRLSELVARIEDGASAPARALLAQLEPSLGGRVHGFAARVALLEGDALGALQAIEAARRALPRDPEPYAAAAEIYAALGRLEAAQREYQRGLDLLGPSPELTRALGVIGLSTPGGASSGLALLRQAQRERPDLPFLARPLAEGHLLVGRAALLRGEPRTALEHAQEGLAAEPKDAELRRLLGEARAAVGELAGAAQLFEDLLAEGRPVAEDLARFHHGAATAALLEPGGRERAVGHYLRARELGYDRGALGFGATVLAERARERTAAAREALGRAKGLMGAAEELGPQSGGELRAKGLGALAEARDLLQEALVADPEHLEARDLLGSALLDLGRPEDAAECFENVLDALVDLGGELPYPVHVNAAQAWRQAGRLDRGAEVLRRELARRPDGPGAALARALLAELESAPR